MSKVSIERITKIVRFMRKRKYVSMAFLKSELEVSEASIKRDLEFLRDRLGCPLEWDRNLRGYVIRDDSAAPGRFELPGVWFDSSEILALLTMLHLLDGIQPGLLEEHVSPLKARLRSMIARGAKSPASLEQKLKLIHFAPRKVEPKHFQTVVGALLAEKRLNLSYWNRERKELSERAISPQQLVHYRENWVLDAWCHQRNALRSFALEAIHSVQVSDETAIQVNKDTMDQHFRSGYGIFAGAATHRARLKFTIERAQWVEKETWHHDQANYHLEDGSYVLEVPYSNDQELLMDILRHSPEVEVLAPPELREKLLAKLRLATEKNNDLPI
ncbi:WYL domain-containing transcriptional regulator [Uliginosibacterium sp. H3]|uniref:WYL domain-containing transcriptional regulator n=1 Tax=Uliginosibacterium silvisoli TaxID=3114758 RepID=A0ABU6K7Z3_9RHOO|nr:WYL domain-containing transcriptional regulator [Uliginosibacterium sp. H3]